MANASWRSRTPLTPELCIEKLGREALVPRGSPDVYCNLTTDQLLCWPAARAGSTVKQPCPPVLGSDTSKLAYKVCGPDGRWESRWLDQKPQPWTNYSPCFSSEAELYFRLDADDIKKTSSEDLTASSILGISGLVLSLLAIFLSLACFRYRELNGVRVYLYKNLLAAVVVDASVKLSFQIILLLVWVGEGVVITMFNIPTLCEIFVVVVEFADLAAYVWTALLAHLCYLEAKGFDPAKIQVLYPALGWGVPAISMAEWLAVQAATNAAKCWYGHHFHDSVWILEVPKIWSLMLALAFLLYTAWSLRSPTERDAVDAQALRRSATACFMYSLLLAVTLSIVLVLTCVTLAAADKNHVLFLVYSITFLASFRGLFLSLGYWVWEKSGGPRTPDRKLRTFI